MKSKATVLSIALFFSVFLLLVSTVYSQEFKIIQGFNLSSYEIQPEVWRDVEGTVYTFESTNREGLLSGIGLEFTISKNVAIEIE